MYGGKFDSMRKSFFIVVLALLVASSHLAADSLKWNPRIYLGSSSDHIIMLFGPPSLVKTEREFSEFVRNKESKCGDLSTYGYSWISGTAGTLALFGPLGPSSSVEIWFENDKCYAVKWTYSGIQQEAAMKKWANSNDISFLQGMKPAVINIGKWKPDKKAVVFVHCFSGGDSKSCKGVITVEYMFDKGN